VSARDSLTAGTSITASAGDIVASAGKLRASTTSSGVASAATLLSEFNATLSVAGTQKLPSGLILQWGQTTTPNAIFVPFNIAFPTACFAVVLSEANALGPSWGSGAPTLHAAGNITAASFSHWTLTWNGTAWTAASAQFSWFAVGY
jgi:hypothetical protein